MRLSRHLNIGRSADRVVPDDLSEIVDAQTDALGHAAGSQRLYKLAKIDQCARLRDECVKLATRGHRLAGHLVQTVQCVTYAERSPQSPYVLHRAA